MDSRMAGSRFSTCTTDTSASVATAMIPSGVLMHLNVQIEMSARAAGMTK